MKIDSRARFQKRAVVVAVVVMALCSCDGPTSPESALGRCLILTESQCIVSTECSLVLVSAATPYACREARGRCETGFVQRDGTAESCEQKPGCMFVPADCYCAPDVVCICGGGPPAQCVERAG